jgi:hypothetical protein
LDVLVINRFDSRCESCGKGASPSEKSHETLLGYNIDPSKKGCGVTWTHVRSDYSGLDDRIARMRPDLKLLAWPKLG